MDEKVRGHAHEISRTLLSINLHFLVAVLILFVHVLPFHKFVLHAIRLGTGSRDGEM